MTQLSTETYQGLLEELDALHTEAKFDLTYKTMEWAHKEGELIRKFAGKGEITDLLKRISTDTNVSERTLWRRVQIYDLDHDFDHLISTQGKNLSMSKLLNPSKENENKLCTHSCPDHKKLV